MQDQLRDAVLSYASNAVYKPVKPGVIAERLGLAGDAADLCKKVIKKMVRDGELEYGENHLILAVVGEDGPVVSFVKEKKEKKTDSKSRPNDSSQDDSAPASSETRPSREGEKDKRGRSSKYASGMFRRISSGDGFVRPEGTPPSAGKDQDIYIHARNKMDAASGDTVRIVLTGKGRRGKPEGKVTDIISRSTNQFVGSYFEEGGMGMVRVDGKVFGEPIYVGDPGAKGANEGDKVVVEMVRFPSHVRDGEGVITQILGERGAPGVDTLAIKYEMGLPGEFSEDVLEETRKQADQFDENNLESDRKDLREEVIITIDPATARDFDDAISLKKIENGHWELGVHIADVSHFVQPKTPLDREAYDRATSVYLPDEVIPMLPEIISNNLASLQPDKVRFAMTAIIEFSPEGMPIGAEMFKSAIKSRRRFTYEEVDQYLATKGLVKEEKTSPTLVAPPSAPSTGRVILEPDTEDSEGEANSQDTPSPAAEKGDSQDLAPEVDHLLADMFSLAMTLRQRRFERGSLELSMPEVRIDLDKKGRVCGAHVEKNTESHQMIEEFMLAANEAVARKLADAGLHFLRRVHGSPDPRKSRALTEFVRSLGLPSSNLQDRFELQQLLNRVKGDPRQYAVNFATLRSMQKAIYSPEDEGHYALASECYCHFTSPIRRYPDLTIHRLINALNAYEAGESGKPVQDIAALIHVGDHCSEREGRAAIAERELTKIKLLNYLTDKVGTELDGIITGVESFGVFIMGTEMPAEGFIHITGLGDDYFKYDRATHSINGFRSGNSFRLGDKVRVAVAAVDVDSRQLDFRFLGRPNEKSSTPKGKTDKRKTDSRKKDRKPGGKKKRPSRGKNTRAKERKAQEGQAGGGEKPKKKPTKNLGKKKTRTKSDKPGKKRRDK